MGIHGCPRHRKKGLLLLSGKWDQELSWFLPKSGVAGSGKHLSRAYVVLATVLSNLYRITVFTLSPQGDWGSKRGIDFLMSTQLDEWWCKIRAPTVRPQCLDSTGKTVAWDEELPGRREQVGDSRMLAGNWKTSSTNFTTRALVMGYPRLKRDPEVQGKENGDLKTLFHSPHNPPKQLRVRRVTAWIISIPRHLFIRGHFPHFYPKTCCFCILLHPGINVTPFELHPYTTVFL